MKLRFRSFESKETLKIEVPTTCSLLHLKDLISQKISSSSSLSSVHLSLNRKDELLGSPQDTLQSLGITSGDLIFFTLNPNGFSSETLIQSLTPLQLKPQPADSLRSQPQAERGGETLVSNARKDETLVFEFEKSEMKPEQVQTVRMSVSEKMDVDDDGSVVEVGKPFSVPSFLRKVFRKEVGDGVGDGGNHKLLVIAVHAVLVESGFVGFDSVSRTIDPGFHIRDEWPSSAFSISLSYTLPKIFGDGFSAVGGVETVVLKFKSMEKYLVIYGALAKDGSEKYRVCLNEERLVSLLNVVWAGLDSIDERNGKSWHLGATLEKEVFEFWKTVKDRIALPLLIDLCEKAGLASPPCFMRLPTDLKLKVLESLPGIDLAKVGCVCSELLYLSSNDDLWKQKFVQQFGNAEGSRGGSHWKEKFAKSWESKKRRRGGFVLRRFPKVDLGLFRHEQPYLNSFGFPGIVGGDYDRLPSPGLPPPPGFPSLRSQPDGRHHLFSGRGNIIPDCDLEGSGV